MKDKPKDIVELAANAGNFNRLAEALRAAGLVDTLKGDGPFTVFAPTDEAFERIPPGALRSLLEDKKKIAAILNRHVVAGTLLCDDLKDQEARSRLGDTLRIAANESGFTVNGAKVSSAALPASNGVIHPIDSVMMEGNP